ncbi:uncharacterized protein LOC124812199 [Hydra vulgaris]|uniref:uncharacterized protein LOC124812199 n=1 Tax=Hydra vulgaris TaxID=6087 RepID=UPI001F5EC2EE|nr:uncharacterized protein LOC124812199 [Hydra vulgaris]
MSIERKHAIAAIVLGGIESAIGVVLSIASSVLFRKKSSYFLYLAYCAGLIILIPGILGLGSGFTRNRSCMIVFMVLNILCFLAESGLVVILNFGYVGYLGQPSRAMFCMYRKEESTCFCSFETVRGVKDCNIASTIFSTLTLLYVFASSTIIVALSSSILGCVAICCKRCNCCEPQTNNGVTVMVPTYLPPERGITLLENGNQPHTNKHL